jgi:hypothetical protein
MTAQRVRYSAACLAPLLCMVVATCPAAEASNSEEQVRVLIQDMPKSVQSQRASLEGLRKIRKSGIPYIVKNLDDMRELPEQRMVIAPPPSMDARMPAQQVNASRVAVALMWVLEEITGKSFGQYLYEFEVQTPEDLSISRWRQWCSETWPDKAAVCWNRQ